MAAVQNVVFVAIVGQRDVGVLAKRPDLIIEQPGEEGEEDTAADGLYTGEGGNVSEFDPIPRKRDSGWRRGGGGAQIHERTGVKLRRSRVGDWLPVIQQRAAFVGDGAELHGFGLGMVNRDGVG